MAETGQRSRMKIGAIRRFVKSLAPGDRVLLRLGYKVLSVGLVADADYEWNEVFADIHGWNVHHTRRVIWQHQLDEELNLIQKKGDLFGGRKQIPMFTAVKEEKILGRIEQLLDKCKSRPLKELPLQPSEPMTLDDFGAELFAMGLPFDSAEKVKVAIERQRSFSKWYDLYGEESGRPTEHEIVAHMVIPLLLGLGWSEQLLAVEWRQIDLAGFWGTPTTPEKCSLVCEAKSRGYGLLRAFNQALSYVRSRKLINCQKILLTDGECLYLYEKGERNWSNTPSGYLNVNHLRVNYLAPAGANAVDTIMALTPAGIGRRIGP